MHIELRIRQLLNSSKKMNAVVEELLYLTASSKTKIDEVIRVTQFLIDAGYYHDGFRQFPRRFAEKSLIPWAQFIELLAQCRIMPLGQIVSSSIEGADETNTLEELVKARAWDTLDIRIKERRTIIIKRLIELSERRHESLMQRIQFLQSHRMLKEEGKAIKKLLVMFPENEEGPKLLKDFEHRWARSILDKRQSEPIESKENKIEIPNHTAEEIKTCDVILTEIFSIVASKPELAYDFAILLMQVEFPESSLKILDCVKKDEKAHWLYLELLLLNHQYFEVLEETSKMKGQNLNSDSEVAFAIAYLRARAMIKLKQFGPAAKTLKSIVQLRPKYRSAGTLLNEILEERVS